MLGVFNGGGAGKFTPTACPLLSGTEFSCLDNPSDVVWLLAFVAVDCKFTVSEVFGAAVAPLPGIAN